ncbi:uncharacterized protein LOC131298428 isoform X2 [Rhododendron vialii]|uniref:uncharacterized protein LOC131298428 isoform X2 n=1 Tax=Rhododendron vialii TaxID=182163 RepID=UPI00265DEBD1|nr:uncharacterized protein LOC131298428 isoform X2 [Rhododendron vialii]
MARNFEKQSVGWNSTPPPAPNQRQFAPNEGNKKDNSCFFCKKEGHWLKDCPMKSPNQGPPTPPPSIGDLHCHCGIHLAPQPSKDNRLYYACPLRRSGTGKGCNFFKRCEDVTRDVNIKVSRTPTCGCSAGPCRMDASRRFFVCPIKKGQGACSFVQPVDSTNNFVDERLLDSTNNILDDTFLDAALDLLEDQLVEPTNDIRDGSPSSPPSTLTSCGDTSPSSRDMVEEGNSSHQGMEIESPVVDTPEHPQKLGTSFELSRPERVSLVDSQDQEDMPEEPLRRNCKRLRHGDPKVDSLVIDSTSDCWDMPQSKSTSLTTEKALRPCILTSGALIRQRQVKFLRQISSAGASLPEASSYSSSSALTTSRELLADYCVDSSAINEILGTNFKGWCGRLVFPPSQSLTFPAPKPFFCGVFPCFDPISLPQDANIPFEICSPSPVESGKQYLLAPFEPSAALLSETSGLKAPPKHFQGKIMKESVMDKFKQAAASLQEDLLILLESMDFHDHASMLEESCSVFGALERLMVDYEPFKEKVMKYIGSAESLARLELSIDNGDWSSRELFDSYNRKKQHLEVISHGHAQTLSNLEASNQHLRYLEQEASRLKDMLRRVEEELACCKVDNMEIDARFNEIAEDRLQLELNLQAAFNEAEEARRVCQRMEAERSAVKASFEEARLELRQSGNMLFLM